MASNDRFDNYINRNATIKSRRDRKGNLRTETVRRNDGFDVAASTNLNTHRTKVFIDFFGRGCAGGADVVLSGREARTMYRLLKKHFEAKGS